MAEVQKQLHNSTLILRLNRLDKYNALTGAMYASLADALIEADGDDKIRVVVITGGETCFTSGNDLRDFLETPPQSLDAPVFRFMDSVISLKKPLIAAVCGAAIGIGTTLLLHCDLVYITNKSKLSVPFVRLGLCPEFGSSLILPSLLGPVLASRLLLCGDTFSGEDAVVWGIASASFDNPSDCLDQALLQAERFALADQVALRETKGLLRESQPELRKVVRAESEAFIALVQREETRKAIGSLIKA